MLLFPTSPFRKRRGRAKGNLLVPPTPPPVPAVVVDAFLSEGGETATLVFDKPVAIAGPPFNFADGSIQFSDHDPQSVSVISENALEFATGTVLSPGSGWAINGQPGWLTTVVAVPQGGNFPE
jgi:hypothetical protein